MWNCEPVQISICVPVYSRSQSTSMQNDTHYKQTHTSRRQKATVHYRQNSRWYIWSCNLLWSKLGWRLSTHRHHYNISVTTHSQLKLNTGFVKAYTHTRLTAFFPGLPGWAGARKAKPIWILLKQETLSGSGISWAMCTSLQTDNHASTPLLKFFYRPDALPVTQPTASKHWRFCQGTILIIGNESVSRIILNAKIIVLLNCNHHFGNFKQ